MTQLAFPLGIRRTIPDAPGDLLRRWVDVALQGRDADALLDLAERAANAILDAQGDVAMWEVRIGLGHAGKLANDGTENLHALGGLARRMGLEYVGSERPPAWAMHVLKCSHGNRHSRWRRPVPRLLTDAERAVVPNA